MKRHAFSVAISAHYIDGHLWGDKTANSPISAVATIENLSSQDQKIVILR